MTEQAHIRVREHEPDLYASREDFHTIFNEDHKELYRLSFLLTRDSEKAEQCFVGGLEDCVAGNSVFHEWARSWAKRAIIQNAIRELKPRPSQSNSPLSGAISPDIDQLSRGPGRHFEMDAVLRLADFERFVFIMSALEHYSEHDCALLLGCSVKEIREGRTRALKEQADLPHMDRSENQLSYRRRNEMTAVAGSANRLTHVGLSLHLAHQQALARMYSMVHGPSSCHFLGCSALAFGGGFRADVLAVFLAGQERTRRRGRGFNALMRVSYAGKSGARLEYR